MISVYRQLRSLKKVVFLFLAAIFLFTSQTMTVAALTPDDLHSIYNDSVWYKIGFTIDPCADGPSGSGPLYGPFYPEGVDGQLLTTSIRNYIQSTLPSSPLASLAPFFVQYGQRYNVNPAMVVAMTQKETSLGTAGYGRPPKHNLGNIRGGSDGTGFASYPSYTAGLEAMYKNLRTELYLDPPSNFTTVAQVINRWAPPSENDTRAYIDFVLDVMKKIIGGINNLPPIEDTCPSEGGGRVDRSGYAFPVAPQRQSQNGGVPGMSPLPCPSTTGCHHDGTPALDISRKPGSDAAAGTPVYAISGGRVDMINIYNGISGCYSLQLHSSKDNFWYWYGHIQNVRVNNGEAVRAGQQLAEIGKRACTGNGSDPHLHIDRGCVRGGVPQRGGRVSCRDPGIIAIINSLFEALPR